MPQPPGQAPTVAQLLVQARAAGVDRLDAQRLLGQALRRSRAWLIAHDDQPVQPTQAEAFAAQLTQRAQGVPLAYLLGEREFHGLMLKVTPDVLVPRPDTEVLVDWALERLPGLGSEGAAPSVADLGTGSGAIALALKHACPAAHLCAVDRNAAALAVARHNGERLQLPVQWLQGDWYEPLSGQHLDLIVSNPPYISAQDPHLSALHAEPLEALTPGGDGLSALRILCHDGPRHLKPGGWLLLEHGFDQAAAVRALLEAAGFQEVQTRRDLAGHERCSGGRWGNVPGS